MFYIVTITNAASGRSLRIVAGCAEPQQIVREALTRAGYTTTWEESELAPYRSQQEKDAAQSIVETVFRRITEES